ncbi:MAG: hypothetical protein COU08_02015 [Candidatus Harrisonbacteria bacterium CG10_big_fil_rev_8_21_14_0_10_42_17]|uniref:prolyl oligopeptidase n=1 Tax=Candidatus Harrisonbacteria bacterium CG10_big_fil_rev_8_21_14_0_10_42_17 TaxID=1974584 RepID=A0A2M6WIF4_9BACT|nr:MAG: hypothetical protein COU08_02015 [Candidatus Harrisonbacteria bacterium CG10_big_fil_rev_8_21_14_0_10_42_17]
MNIEDTYSWLEENSTRTREWIDEQYGRGRKYLDALPQRKTLEKRLIELSSTDTIGVPVPRGGKYFSMDRAAGQDLGVLYVQDRLGGEKRVLVDQNELSRDGSATISYVPTRDGKYIALGISQMSNDEYGYKVMDVDSGDYLEDEIPSHIYPQMVHWDVKNRGFWYTRRAMELPEKGEEKLHRKVFYHALGTNWKSDPIVFGAEIHKQDIPIFRVSDDGRYAVVNVYKTRTEKRSSDVYVRDLENPNSEYSKIVGSDEYKWSGWIHRDHIYLQTNQDAPRGRVLRVKTSVALKEKSMESAEEIVIESDAVIEGVKTVGDILFVRKQKNVQSVLEKSSLDGNEIKEISLPNNSLLTAMIGENEGSEVFFGITSFLTPHTIFRLSLNTDTMNEYARVEVPFDATEFETEQVWYESTDGEKVPMFLVHKKGLPKDSKRPVLLNGYGGFNISYKPSFRQFAIPIIEAGGIFAVAGIRGGGEFGEKWHEAGMKENKQQVFDDFVAAAKWLEISGYTTLKQTAIFGWSNGGLLTSAVLTQNPNLFGAVVVGAPVADMLKFASYADSGKHWRVEYGDPDKEDDRRFLLKYSPYHNIQIDTAYSPTLIVTADKDDRVVPTHAFKFSARLQESASSPSDIIVRLEKSAGHGSSYAKKRRASMEADILAFVFKHINIKQ